MTNKVDVLGIDGKKAGQVELPAEIFDVEPNIPLMHQVVVAQLAAARQGTHSTKTRSEVSGGGKKPWRQKGTGRARHGSIRAPQWTGGGIVHGPTPRKYNQRTPKKMIAAALRSALSDRAREGLIFVVDQIVKDAPSTKKAAEFMAGIGDYTSFLVVLERSDEINWLSVRNLVNVRQIAYDQLNAYDVLSSQAVVFTKGALEAFKAGPVKGKSVKAVARESEAEEAAK